MATIYDFDAIRQQRGKATPPRPSPCEAMDFWPHTQCRLYSFSHEHHKRLSRELYAEADRYAALGAWGDVATAIEMARIIDEFELGIDTGMDEEMWNKCAGI